MNHDEMLHRLGLTDAQLKDMLAKFRALEASLDHAQQAAFRRSIPTLTDAMEAFGDDVTKEQLLKMFEGDKHTPPVIICIPMNSRG
jgi:hypothetical protein